MSNNKTDALNFVRREGPVQPSQLAAELNTNILFASAILSELVSGKEVKITNVKKGGSPFYYVKGQEVKLERLSSFLTGKPLEAFQLLKDKKVIRDRFAEPWQRVALRELKDFAIQLNVGLGGEYELFWKWYLTTNEDTKLLIKDIVRPNKKKVIKKDQEVSQKENKDNNSLLKKNSQLDESVSPNTKDYKKNMVSEPTQLTNFPKEVSNFFSKNQIYMISQKIIRKNKEINFVGDLPSRLGPLRYFIKFKDKKSITDSDLISSLDEASMKKLPLLFISKGNLNRKAEIYFNENSSGKLIFRNLD